MFATALATFWPAHSAAQPSQRPLFVTSTGAKPNILVSLDNSSSMALPYPDDYVVTVAGDRTKDPAHYWAQRSSDVNELYYNPRVKYEPRVDVNGQALAVTDGIAFVSNEKGTTLSYNVFAESAAQVEAVGSKATFVSDASFPNPNATRPAGWNTVIARQTGLTSHVPLHTPYTADKKATAPPFSYAICKSGTDRTNLTCEKLLRVVEVRGDATESDTIELPVGAGEQRPDCKEHALVDRCTQTVELANILNWYRYYRNRIEATKTALGQAFQNDKLGSGLARIGYQPINLTKTSGSPPQVGAVIDKHHALRGVRPWVKGATANREFYDWLYGVYLVSGTPLQQTFNQAANYFRVGQNIQENAWAKRPSEAVSKDNPEMSCRRSFHVMLSDGAWNAPFSPGEKSGNEDAEQGPRHDGVAADGKSLSFSYNPTGDAAKLSSYVPYSNAKGTFGLADLAAKYYWHEDFRPQLSNGVSTRAGQPTFWQNIRTYTIGYMIHPSGEARGATHGLTFDEINTYTNKYILKGYASAPAPSWPGGDLRTASEASRIDDFIQAGYSGGGRSFAVQDADGIRKAVDAILSDIMDASGDDAGIALSGSSNNAAPQEGRLKFKVQYRTTDNIGDVVAQQLDEKGDPKLFKEDINGQKLDPESDAYWSASQQIPPYANRRIYSIDNAGSGFELKGRLDQLPSSVRLALRSGEHAKDLPDDDSFVNYLRGKDPVSDLNKDTYRLRVSRMGAIVNSPPLLLGAGSEYGYAGANSTVSGKSTYGSFRRDVYKAPDALLVATNAGVVHALSDKNGREFAAFMPRRSMSRLLDQAQGDSEFRYVLDGPLSSNDVFDGKSWHQLIVGSGGRGERVVYALQPRMTPQGDVELSASDYRWEAGPDTIDKAADGDADFFATGYMSNPARSGQTASGDWVVVLNSGHYNGSPDGTGHGLVVFNANTGAVIRTLSLPAKYPAGRGLGGVTLVRNASSRIVAAYAGDASGQLWRFDLSGDPANWKVAYGKPLFKTENGRPIYAGPAFQPHPKGGHIVVVATGMLLDDSDTVDSSVREAIYGVWDPTSRQDGAEASDFETIKPDQLLEQTVQELGKSETVGTDTYYSISRNRIRWQGENAKRGWKLLLGGWNASNGMTRAGERVVQQVANLSTSVRIDSVVVNRNNVQDESCTANDPPGSMYILNALDGAGKRAFDINNDGRLDDFAMVFLPLGGFSRGSIWVETTPPPASQKPVETQNPGGSGAGEGESSGEVGSRDGTRFDLTRDGESPGDATGECERVRGKAKGTKGTGPAAGVDCASGWSRQQYQLTRLPQ